MTTRCTVVLTGLLFACNGRVGEGEDGEIAATDEEPIHDLATPDLPQGPGCLPAWLSEACPWDLGAVMEVSGETPLGPVKYDRAYFGPMACGPCAAAKLGRLFLLPEEGPPPEPTGGGDFDWGSDYAELSLYDPQMSENDLAMSVWWDAEHISVGGVAVEFDAVLPNEDWYDPLPPDQPLRITGTINIDQSGWSVSGSFDATFCGYAVGRIPCE